MSHIKRYLDSLNENKVEGELIKTVLYSLITSFIVLSILYYAKFKLIENFLSKYGLFFLLIAISYSLILSTMRQVRAYKIFSCMPGMMIGMTFGMVAGFLAGFYAGATNGMFWGSMFGMLIGITLGIWSGYCCGVMGVMEGIMAGFMGGLMGAMSSVMMLNDHLIAATIVVSIVCWIILIGLSYMIFKETIQREIEYKEDYSFTIIWSAILTTATSLFMVYGPRGGIA